MNNYINYEIIFIKILLMQQFVLNCRYKGHEFNKVKYLCIDDQCKRNRLFCYQCFKDDNHKHKNYDNNHIFNVKEFKQKIQQDVEFLKDNHLKGHLFYQQVIKNLRILIRDIQYLLEHFQNTIQEIEQNPIVQLDLQNLDLILKQSQELEFCTASDELLNTLINVNQYQFKKDLQINTNKMSDELLEKVSDMKELSNQLNYNTEMRQIYKIQNLSYRLINIDRDNNIQSAAMSNNNQIALTKLQNKLQIWKDSKFYHQQQLNQNINICRFSEDSQYLFIGTQLGNLIQYDNTKQFNEIYNQQIHQQGILNLFCITSNIILSSSFDRAVIKTHLTNKQQLLKIQAHNDRVDGLDYDWSRKIIVSCSHDRSIKFWNDYDGSLQIEKINAHNNNKLFQVLCIKKYSRLVSLDQSKCFKIWLIQYEDKELQELQQIVNQDFIYNISLIFDQSFISQICSNYIQIHTISGKLVHVIQHDVKDIGNLNIQLAMYKFVQPEKMQSLLIKGKCNYHQQYQRNYKYVNMNYEQSIIQIFIQYIASYIDDKVYYKSSNPKEK
ncbi:WD domain repeat-containing protein 55 [Paramecium bursaria]